MHLFLMFMVIFVGANGKEEDLFSEKNQQRLPPYTELDDYDRCLSRENGLYCFGTFRIHPKFRDNEAYNFIKKYSAQDLKFDRTLYHRGYCVSDRCHPNSNTTKRFEECVQELAQERSLNTTLETLHYCRTRKKVPALDVSSYLYIIIVFLILLANIAGTVIDLKNKDGIKSNVWASWSIRSNWKQLIGPFGTDSDMTSLAPIQFMRVVLIPTVIFIHVIVLKLGSCLDNPYFIEKLINTPFIIMSLKGGSVVQIFYSLSSFLTTYNLLLLSKRQAIGLWMLPKQFFKRYFRIAPVHLLFTGFAATLWPLISDGPMWSAMVDTESAICRRKAWYHLFHINNIVEPTKYCLPPTWSLAGDIQLQLVAIFLTLSLVQYNLPKIKTLISLLISSCVLNAGLAYVNGWKPLIHMINEMNIADSIYQDLSYVSFYVSPLGSLSSSLVGVIMGHIYFQSRQEGFRAYKHKWLRFLCRYSLHFLALWTAAGYFTLGMKSPLFLALHQGIDRPMFSLFPCIWLFGLISGIRIFPGFKKTSYRMWTPLGRLSLSVLMLHWVVITTRLASLPHPVVLSWETIVKEFVAACSYSYILAVPVTLLVELPVQNTFNHFSSLHFKILMKNK